MIRPSLVECSYACIRDLPGSPEPNADFGSEAGRTNQGCAPTQGGKARAPGMVGIPLYDHGEHVP